MKVYSPIATELLITHPQVFFVDGYADVDEETAAMIIKAFPDLDLSIEKDVPSAPSNEDETSEEADTEGEGEPKKKGRKAASEKSDSDEAEAPESGW